MNQKIKAQMHDALDKRRNMNVQKAAQWYNAQDVKRWMHTKKGCAKKRKEMP